MLRYPRKHCNRWADDRVQIDKMDDADRASEQKTSEIAISPSSLPLQERNGLFYSEGEIDESLVIVDASTTDPTNLTIDKRRTNALIEKSSFPRANIASKIGNQQNFTYENCTFHCCGKTSGTIERPSETEVVSPFRRCLTDTDISPSMHDGNVGRKTSQGSDNTGYTSVSEKIFFYNVCPLRKRTRIFLGKQQHAVNKWRYVAVKLVPFSARNLQEIEFLLNLEGHPNIVKIIESHELFGHIREIYIAMELCSLNLREYVTEMTDKLIDYEVTMSYVKQLINGLDYIHSNGVIHGDLKPDNILFSRNMKYIKISDFGLSKDVLDESSAGSNSSSLPGTEGFRAPEVYYDPPELTLASDIFSIAIVIFYFTTFGLHPFGTSPHDWGYNIRNSKDRDLSPLYQLRIPSSLQIGLFELIGSSLRKEPTRRPTANKLMNHQMLKGVGYDIPHAARREIPIPSSFFVNRNSTEELKPTSPPQPDPDVPFVQLPSFGSFTSSYGSFQSRSGQSSEASLQQRLDDLEVFCYYSLTRYLDSRAAKEQTANTFNSYPRSSNVQYPSENTAHDTSYRREKQFATTSRITTSQAQHHTYSEWLGNEVTKTPRRQTSRKAKPQMKSKAEKACFQRSSSFRFNQFQANGVFAANQESIPQADSNNGDVPAMPEKIQKKQSKKSIVLKWFKKKY